MKTFIYICTLLTISISISQAAISTPSMADETKDSPPKMSEKEFFKAVQMPEYGENTKKAMELYNKDKYQESIELSKKTLDLYNERYEVVKEGYEKYGASKAVQTRFECIPIYQYAMASYANAAATEHGSHTIQERYFMLLKANKLFEYIHSINPDDYDQLTYFSTTSRLLYNARTKSKFDKEDTLKYEALAKSYDFTKEKTRTLKNAVELINKVDKLEKEYRQKTANKPPQPAADTAEGSSAAAVGEGEKVTGLD